MGLGTPQRALGFLITWCMVYGRIRKKKNHLTCNGNTSPKTLQSLQFMKVPRLVIVCWWISKQSGGDKNREWSLKGHGGSTMGIIILNPQVSEMIISTNFV